MDSNTAAISGGNFYIDGTGSVTLTIDQSTVTNNLASAGYGSVVATTATINAATVVLSSSNANTNTAKLDGGLFYLNGIGAKSLTIDSSQV